MESRVSIQKDFAFFKLLKCKILQEVQESPSYRLFSNNSQRFNRSRKLHRKALPMSRFRANPHPIMKFLKKNVIPWSQIFRISLTFFQDIHCRCWRLQLPKSDKKPTYQSPDYRVPHNLTFFDPEDKPVRYDSKIFLPYCTKPWGQSC